MFYENFVASQWFGPLVKLFAAIGICLLISGAAGRGVWDWALAGVLVIQLVVWTGVTRGMPARFLVPALAPLCLLAGGALGQLARVRGNPLRGMGAGTEGTWGRPAAAAAFIAAAAVNLVVTYGVFRNATDKLPKVYGMPGRDVATMAPFWNEAHKLPEGSRILLIGDAKAFYFPQGTLYSTTFDAETIVEMLGKGIDGLHERGITHVWVDWPEVLRLTGTYGYPATLGAEPYRIARENRLAREKRPLEIPLLERLKAQGLRHMQDLPPRPSTKTATSRPSRLIVTIYSVGPGLGQD